MYMVRAADALLRVGGGRNMLLRAPAPAAAGDETEQLGLATPLFQDFELGPAVFRKARGSMAADKTERWELMVSATAVQGLTGSLACSAASVLFAGALGVVIDGVLMEIESATQSEVGGMPYVYRLLLQAPHVQTV
jgi:hypothetical protein